MKGEAGVAVVDGDGYLYKSCAMIGSSTSLGEHEAGWNAVALGSMRVRRQAI